ncbi:DNA-(apurinic or apyrimidinic site) lyase 2 [Sparganum proliferum]
MSFVETSLAHFIPTGYTSMLRVCTWNVNGSLPAEFCQADDYNAYFSHCTSKSGYSGVCIFCRNPLQPTSAVEGFEDLLTLGGADPSSAEGFDSEGRVLALQFGLPLSPSGRLSLTVVCLYCPRVDPERQERAAYRVQFFELLQKSLTGLIASGSYVVLAGDFNIVHKPIDHCCLEEFKLLDPEPRIWMDSLLVDPLKFRDCVGTDVDAFDGSHLVDLFRLAQPDRANAFTCWNTRTGARQTNYGTRIDYILCDTGLARRFPSSERLSSVCDLRVDVLGSDHCPVWARLPLTTACQLRPHDLSAGPPPDLCTCFWPQCQKRQSRIWQFLQPTADAAAALKRDTSDCQKTSPVVKRQKQTQLTLVRTKSLTPAHHNGQEWSGEAGVREGPGDRNKQDANGVQSAAAAATLQWSQIFRRPQKAPRCSGHQEPCVRRTVKRASSNRGRDFWVCPRPDGAPGNPEARCSTFIWADKIDQ